MVFTGQLQSAKSNKSDGDLLGMFGFNYTFVIAERERERTLMLTAESPTLKKVKSFKDVHSYFIHRNNAFKMM